MGGTDLFRASGPLLGAHVSAAGGVDLAVPRARALGCRSLQLFVRNPNQWRSPRLAPETVEAFHEARREGGRPLAAVAHAGYLINLAATDRGVLARSRRALVDELERARRLGLDAVVVHPGAHLGAGPEKGMARAARSLDAVLAERPADDPVLLLENTAGQGTLLGAGLEELAGILDRCAARDRLGLCVDSCHAFAAGHALHDGAGYEAFWERLDRLLGRERLRCVHVNDSREPFGSRRDRHANLGRGRMGLEVFRRLTLDPRLDGLPLVLETPRGEDGAGHRRDLELLRRYAGSGRRGAS